MIPDYCKRCGKRTESTLFCASMECTLHPSKNKEALLVAVGNERPLNVPRADAFLEFKKEVKAHKYDSCPELWAKFEKLKTWTPDKQEQIGVGDGAIVVGSVVSAFAGQTFTSSQKYTPIASTRAVKIGQTWRHRDSKVELRVDKIFGMGAWQEGNASGMTVNDYGIADPHWDLVPKKEMFQVGDYVYNSYNVRGAIRSIQGQVACVVSDVDAASRWFALESLRLAAPIDLGHETLPAPTGLLSAADWEEIGKAR